MEGQEAREGGRGQEENQDHLQVYCQQNQDVPAAQLRHTGQLKTCVCVCVEGRVGRLLQQCVCCVYNRHQSAPGIFKDRQIEF